jgi:hypothetical protein
MAKHPVPKKKTSKSKRDMRRSHHALVAPNLTKSSSTLFAQAVAITMVVRFWQSPKHKPNAKSTGTKPVLFCG